MQKQIIQLLQLLCAILVMSALCLAATFWIHTDFISNLHCLYVAVPVVLCKTISEKSKSIFFFLLCSVLMAAATFLLAAKGAEQYMFTFVTIVICSCFFISKSKQQECFLLHPSLAVIGVFFGVNLLGSTQGFPYLCIFAHYFTVIYLLAFLLYTNLYNFQDFVRKNFQSANLPYDRIHGINRLLITITTVIAAVVLFSIPASGMEGAAAFFKKLLSIIFRPLFMLLEGMQDNDLPPETAPYIPQAPDLGNLALQPGESSAFWSVVSSIFVTLFFVVFFIGLIYLIRLFIKNYHREISKDEDVVEFINTDSRAVAMDREDRPNQLPFASNDPNVLIRRQYKKLILSRQKADSSQNDSFRSNHPLLKDLPPEEVKLTWRDRLTNLFRPGRLQLPDAAYTPAELETDCGIEDAMLHTLYEQARYSRNGCTAEDAQRLKKHLQR